MDEGDTHESMGDPNAGPPAPSMGDPNAGPPAPSMGDPNAGPPAPSMGDPNAGPPAPSMGDPNEGPQPDEGAGSPPGLTGANADMSLESQYAAYGAGRAAAETISGYGLGTAFNGGGSIGVSAPSDFLGGLLTLGRAALSVLGLSNPVTAPGAALSLGDMLHRGAFSKVSFSSPASGVMNGASESWGSPAPDAGRSSSGAGWGYTSPVVGWYGATSSPTPASQGAAPNALSFGKSFGYLPTASPRASASGISGQAAAPGGGPDLMLIAIAAAALLLMK